MADSSDETPRVRLQRTESWNRFQWTEELLELLGVLTDAAVAEKAGVHLGTVVAERRRRGIPPARPRRPRIEWTEDMIAALGTASDAAVAEALGLNRSTVRSKRQRLGIPPFHPPPHDLQQGYTWRSEDLALLGKVSDGSLARALDLNTSTVTVKRQKLGIPPFQPKPPPIEWTPAKIERLGKAPDHQIAEELGISTSSVLAKRQELGIAAIRMARPVKRNEQVAELLRLPNMEVVHRTGLEWGTVQRLRKHFGIPQPTFQDMEVLAEDKTGREGSTTAQEATYAEILSELPEDWRSNCPWEPEEIAAVGTAPDAEIARRLGRTTSAVESKRISLGLVEQIHRRWEAAEIEHLGTAPDPEVAERLGRTLSSVRDKRYSLGIPSFLGRGKRWKPHEVKLLGTAPDSEIAERLGRSYKAVNQKRRKLGIPNFAQAARDRK